MFIAIALPTTQHVRIQILFSIPISKKHFALFCLRRLAYTNNNLEVGICKLSVSVHETHVTTSVSHNGVQCLSGLEVLAAAGE